MKYATIVVAVVSSLAAVPASTQAQTKHIKEVNLVHFSHTDVGFTDHPAVCRDLYRRYLDVALDLILDGLKRAAQPDVDVLKTARTTVRRADQSPD